MTNNKQLGEIAADKTWNWLGKHMTNQTRHIVVCLSMFLLPYVLLGWLLIGCAVITTAATACYILPILGFIIRDRICGKEG